jgi:hypothetical protein
MRQRAYIKSTKSALVIGIIVVIAFIVFGIFFFSLLSGESGSEIGQTFMGFWFFILLIIGGIFVYNLINYDKNPGNSIAEEIDLPEDFGTKEGGVSFDEKLRKLENLKKEGLINDAEFAAKRREIMEQKW